MTMKIRKPKEDLKGYGNFNANTKFLDIDTIRRINSNIEILVEAQKRAGTTKCNEFIRDWQWFIMLNDESRNENWD